MMVHHATTLRWVRSLFRCAGVAILLLATTSTARAGIIIPELSVVGGTGVAGSTVSVTLALADDITDTASSADLNLAYPPELVTFFPPVAENCTVDPRIVDDYAIGGRLAQDGLVVLSIFVKGTPPVIPHLGNGPLASCDFFINEGVAAGTAALTIEDAALFDEDGGPLDVNTKDGSIVITDITPTLTPTATPTTPPTATTTVTRTATRTVPATSTNTPQVTSTVTNTPVVTSTATRTPPVTATATNTPATPTPNTPTATATATRTGPTPTKKPGNGSSGGCDIVAANQSTSAGTLALLLAPGLLVWARRRRF